MELYAMPAATASLLEDSVVDLDEWIASEVEAAFAEQEGAAFVNGDGADKPRGFLDYHGGRRQRLGLGQSLARSTPAWLAHLPASNASDVLIDTIYALKAGYRQNATWVMNRKVQASIRKLKDADGNYLWQPPAVGRRQRPC
jgi:HK97 family phage major capsid protein